MNLYQYNFCRQWSLITPARLRFNVCKMAPSSTLVREKKNELQKFRDINGSNSDPIA